MRHHRFPHVVLQPPGKTDLRRRRKPRKKAQAERATLGIFKVSAEICPLPPRKDVPSAGDPKSSTGQPDLGLGNVGALDSFGSSPGIGPTGEIGCFPVQAERKSSP